MKNNISIEQCSSYKEEVFQYGRKRTGLIYLLRNLIWDLGNWNTKELKKWLNKMKPQKIFFVASDYTFAFKIAMKISVYLKIPLFIYFTDEFYRKNLGNKNIFNLLSKYFYRKYFKKIIKICKSYFTITKEMLLFYEKEFNKKGYILMNTTNIHCKELNNNLKKEKILIRYIGNMGYCRWKNIIMLNNIFKELNLQHINKIIFEVYSGEKNEEILKQLKNNLENSFKGAISKEEVEKKINESDILIHTESFENIEKEKIKYSLSTKIPDLMASGKLILAFGPEEISSIKYIKENNIGLFATNSNQLKNILNDILNNKIEIKEILENELKLVENNHRVENNHLLLYNILNGDDNENSFAN